MFDNVEQVSWLVVGVLRLCNTKGHIRTSFLSERYTFLVDSDEAFES